MVKKNITMEDLAMKLDGIESGLTKKINDVEQNLSKRIEGEIAGLAIITKHGFDAVDKRFDKVDKRFAYLEQGQEDVKLRLDNVAHRFELQELARRVTLIEKKVKLS